MKNEPRDRRHSTDLQNLQDLLGRADWLRPLARSLVFDQGEAEDCIQETWIAARGATVPRGASPRPWLGGILRNVARMRARGEARRRRRDRSAARPESLPSTLDHLELVERQRALLDAVETLPEAQRRAIVSRFFEGLPPREIAAREGAPVATVESRIQRGLADLRSQLDEGHGGRRDWALWLAPVAMAPKGSTPSVGAALLLLLAIGGGLVAWARFQPGEGASGGPARVVSLEDSGTQDVPPGSEGIDPAPSPTGGTRNPLRSELRLTVLEPDGTTPLAGARVFVLQDSEASTASGRTDAAFPTTHLWNLGERFVSDSRGEVTLPAGEGGAVLALSEDSAAIHRFAGADRHLDLVTRPAHRVRVRIVDSSGQTVPDELGVRFQIEMSVAKPGVEELSTETYTETCFAIEGLVEWVDPWIMAHLLEEPPTVPRVVVDRIHLDIPGAEESEGRGQAWLGAEVSGEHATTTEVQLELPPTGRLELRIEDKAGERVALDGTATLEVLSARGSSASDAYSASLRRGFAHWPHVVTGGRRVRVRVDTPSLGATWTTEGQGPGGEGETSILTTAPPNRPALTARLLDSNGAPLELERVDLYFSTRSEVRFNDFKSARSDHEGRIRFELPEEPIYGPLSLTTHSSSGFRVRVATTILQSDGIPIVGAMDFGDVTLVFEPERTLEGTVHDEAGTPLAGMRVTITRRGRFSFGTRTDAEGRFSLRVVPGPEETLEVLDYDDGFLSTERIVGREEFGVPVEVVLRRGSEFEVQLDPGAFGDPPPPVRILFFPEDGGQFVAARSSGSGQFLATNVRPGRYRVELRLRGNHPFLEVDGVVVPEGGRGRSSRLDSIRLEDHLRRIRVLDGNAPVPRSTRMSVSVPDTTGVRRTIHTTNPGEPFDIPRHGPFTLAFQVPNRGTASVSADEVTGDTLDLRFPEPIHVVFEVAGPSGSVLGAHAPRFSLHPEGDRSSVFTVPLDLRRIEEGHLEVAIPTPGLYRLFVSDPPEDHGGGVMSAAIPVPTTATVDIVSPTAGSEAPMIFRLDLDAPRAAVR